MTSSHLVPTSSDEVTSRHLVHLVPSSPPKGTRTRTRSKSPKDNPTTPTTRDEVNPPPHTCPTCHAQPGHPCTTTTGIDMTPLTHQARKARNAERATTPATDQLDLDLKETQQ